MAAELIKYEKLRKWTTNYDDTAIGRETKNVVFFLEDLKEMIAYCENHPNTSEINAVRLYLVRQNEFDRDLLSNGQSQISIVATPVLNYSDNEFGPDDKLSNPSGGNDVLDGKDLDEVFAVYPLSSTHEHSGLCPYNCKGSLNALSADNTIS